MWACSQYSDTSRRRTLKEQSNRKLFLKSNIYELEKLEHIDICLLIMLLVACLLYLLCTFLLFSFIFFRFLKKKCNFASGNSVICRIWIDFHCRYLTLASSSAHAEPQARQPFVRGGWVGKEDDDILKGVYLTLIFGYSESRKFKSRS